MGIEAYKIKSEDFNSKDIMGLPDKPSEAGISAATLKERFDAGAKQVVAPKLNALIDALSSTEGAANIGAVQIAGVSGYTVQEILAAMKVLLDTKQSIEQSNLAVNQKFDKTEAQALVKEIGFAEHSGSFTITKYDGSVQTIDTALEKVALDVRLEGQQFVLTLADGTEQSVDLSAFLTQTELKDSTTIALAEEAGILVARLLLASVTKDHLAADVTAYLEAKESAAAASAAEAGVQAGNALSSANSAAGSKVTAQQWAESACGCAANAAASEAAAGEKASAASLSAADAAVSASDAASEANRAKTEADRASEIAGGDFATKTEFEAHANDKENPHGVTAEQIGALPVSGGRIEGNLTIVGEKLLIGSDTVEITDGMNSLFLSGNMLYSGFFGKEYGLFTWNGNTSDTAFQDAMVLASLSEDGTITGVYRLYGAHNIDALKEELAPSLKYYGTCSTAAGTRAKTVACPGFSLESGAAIIVKFTYTNTAANPTLNVNGTGAKSIYYRGAAISAGYLAANRTYQFVYNGTQYELVGDIDTNTTYESGTVQTLPISLTTSTNYSTYYKQADGTVVLNLNFSLGTANMQTITKQDVSLGVLPAGYRPSGTVGTLACLMHDATVMAVVQIYIYATGYISFNYYGGVQVVESTMTGWSSLCQSIVFKAAS